VAAGGSLREDRLENMGPNSHSSSRTDRLQADRDRPRVGPWRTLLTDPVVRLGAFVLGALSLPFLVPGISAQSLEIFSERWADHLQFPLLLLAFGYGLARVAHREQRRFSTYIMCALAAWWVVRLSYVLLPDAPGTFLGDMAVDGLYVTFYVFMILAIESRPHLESGWIAFDPTRRFRLASSLGFLFALLAYFVFIPSALNPEFYYTWLPSLYMYVTLDLFLAVRFFYARATSSSNRFRRVYLLLGLAATGWAVFDVFECLSWAGVLTVPPGTALDLLWWTPIPLVLLAGRSQYVASVDHARDLSVKRRPADKPRTLRAVAPQVAVAFLIPSMHLALHAAGLLDSESRFAREVLVLASLLVFGSLVLVQQYVLERGNRNLQGRLQEINEQLEQSQKMEAVGRLAGGVAHDFNNLLTAIMGHTRLLLDRLPGDSVNRREVERIDQVSRRAATLTKQLLAFSRRQVLRPEILDLNSVINDIREMIQRMIGEDIELVCPLDPDLGSIRADRGQLEQVILNLCVNSRDAMPDGGCLTIQTYKQHLPCDSPDSPAEFPVGTQVALVVRDTGQGMDEGTRERVFEPFFTTKELGKGTGLGLSTVYGIVRQSEGHIRIESEPGQGTAIWIYFPWRGEMAPAFVPQLEDSEIASEPRRSSGDETILLVEDEEVVRDLAHEILQMNGYRVVTASHGQEALRVYDAHEGRIDLLLTDVVMPVMGGRELANHLAGRQQDLRVLFVSGYSGEVAFHEGLLETRAFFLGKPFTPFELIDKVRRALHAPTTSIHS
jgi:signal transduction histidine kinase/CheY-like chemotaxis protein